MPCKILTLLAVLLLCACASQKKYEAMLDTWIGKSERELVETWGIPDKQYQLDAGTRMLAYVKRRTATYPGSSVSSCYGNIAGRAVASTCIGGLPPETRTFHCETTFSLVDGRVARWGTSGNDCAAW